MADEGGQEEAAALDMGAGVRWLTPENTEIRRTDPSRVDCAVKGSDVYPGVHAKLLFPVRHPKGFVSLRYTDEEGRVREIGVIEKLVDFPEAQRRLTGGELAKQYYEQTIERIYRVESEYGLLFFDVETQRGREQFVMPWRAASTEDYGTTGKVLYESLGNRYIVADVEALPPADRRRFTSHVYW